MQQSKFLKISFGIILLLALGFRVIWLSNIPGINGDEAEIGVWSLAVLNGEPVWWKTNNGNLINPFYSTLTAITQAVLPISFVTLRISAVISGLTLLVWNFWAMRKILSLQTALITTIILAVLPINIAYSRFGWGPSQTVLFSSFVLLLALSKKWKLSFIALICSFLVHPTNIFLILPTVGIWVGFQKDHYKSFSQTKWQPLLKPSIILFTLFLIWKQKVYTSSISDLSLFDATYFSLDNIFLYLLRIGRLVTGATIYEFIAGSVAEKNYFLFDSAFIVGLILYLSQLKKQIKHWPNSMKGFGIGFLCAQIVNAFIAGPQTLAPHFERYGLWMVFPAVVLVSYSFTNKNIKKHFPKTVVITFLIALVYLGSFWHYYFAHILQTGGTSHRTFITSAIEPKQQVVEYLRSQATKEYPATVYAQDWWLYWPMKYLTFKEEFILVQDLSELESTIENLNSTKKYVVTFAESELSTALQQDGNYKVVWFNSFSNQPVIGVWSL